PILLDPQRPPHNLTSFPTRRSSDLPGKTESWKRWVQEMASTRLSEFQASRKRLGITREVSCLQQTPQGDMAILYIEAEDMARVFQGLATSQDAFDALFRQNTQEFFGL